MKTPTPAPTELTPHPVVANITFADDLNPVFAPPGGLEIRVLTPTPFPRDLEG